MRRCFGLTLALLPALAVPLLADADTDDDVMVSSLKQFRIPLFAPMTMSAQPAARRCSSESRLASSMPMPAPSAARVPAMRARSGRVIVVSDMGTSSRKGVVVFKSSRAPCL
jgi:hypothetical protein